MVVGGFGSQSMTIVSDADIGQTKSMLTLPIGCGAPL